MPDLSQLTLRTSGRSVFVHHEGRPVGALIQNRSANPVNEITGLTNIMGPAWTSPAYDAAGNMTTIPWGGTAPAAGLAWSSLSLDDWSNLTIDDWSELTVDASAPALAGALTATYDAWNRLVKLVDSDTDAVVQENEYDARTFRTVMTTSAGTRHYYYTPGWRCVEERVGSSTEAERQFVWGLRYIDDLILRDRDTDNDDVVDERLYALQDANWNVVALADSEGAVQQRFAYSPYGVMTPLTSEFVPTDEGFDWEITYAGYRWDVAAGMYAVRFRYYQPELGAWVTRDPLGYIDGSNLLQYVGGSSLTRTDPAGLAWDFGDPHVAACHRNCLRQFEQGRVFTIDECMRGCVHPPQPRPDTSARSRNLTPHEQECLQVIFGAAFPHLGNSENGRQAIARLLSQITLWDAETVQGWHTYHPWNVIAQNAIYHSGAGGVTLGTHQYYTTDQYPTPNNPSHLPLLAHESTHSLHAQMTGGTALFLIAYLTDSATAGIYEDDAYRDNVSEWLGYAMQSTVEQMLQDSEFMRCFNGRRCEQISNDTRERIRRRFLSNLSAEMGR